MSPVYVVKIDALYWDMPNFVPQQRAAWRFDQHTARTASRYLIARGWSLARVVGLVKRGKR